MDSTQADGPEFDILAQLRSARDSAVPIDDKFSKLYPSVWKLLCIKEGLAADGRNSTSIVIVNEAAAFTAIVSVKSAGVSKAIPIPGLLGLWKELELGLMDQSIPWRPMKDWKEKPAAKENPKKS